MTNVCTTTSDTKGDNRSETGWREAVSAHAEAEKILRVVFDVAKQDAQKPHRYYRAILRGPSGKFHLAGGHVRVDGGAYVQDRTTGSEPPFWVECRCGLRGALHAVNSFVPRLQSGGAYIAVQFLEGRRKCQVLWRLMKETTRSRSSKGNGERAADDFGGSPLLLTYE